MKKLSERPFMPKPGPQQDQFFGVLISNLTKILGEIVQRSNISITNDGDERMVKPFRLVRYTVATLPDPATLDNQGNALYTAGLIYVTDETGGPTVAYGDGTDWRRIYDNAVVS